MAVVRVRLPHVDLCLTIPLRFCSSRLQPAGGWGAASGVLSSPPSSHRQGSNAGVPPAATNCPGFTDPPKNLGQFVPEEEAAGGRHGGVPPRPCRDALQPGRRGTGLRTGKPHPRDKLPKLPGSLSDGVSLSRTRKAARACPPSPDPRARRCACSSAAVDAEAAGWEAQDVPPTPRRSAVSSAAMDAAVGAAGAAAAVATAGTAPWKSSQSSQPFERKKERGTRASAWL